jgi:hypothetical protein
VLYALLLCHDENLIVGTEADQVVAFDDFTAKMGDRIVVRALLRPTWAATSVNLRDPRMTIVDRSFAQTTEQIAGVIVVDCAHLDEAIEAVCSLPTRGYETIEIRPLWKIDGRLDDASR